MHVLKEKLAYSDEKGLEIFIDQFMEEERQGRPWCIDSGPFDAILIHRDLNKLREPLLPQERDRALQALSREEEIRQRVAEQLPHLTAIRYSDQDLLEFCAAIPASKKQYLSHFFRQLYEQGQMTPDQYQRLLAAEGLEKSELPVVKGKSEVILEQDLFVRVVLHCLEHCMHSGSRLGAYLRLSNYEEARFFDPVITNPDLDYFEEMLEIGGSGEHSLLAMRVYRR